MHMPTSHACKPGIEASPPCRTPVYMSPELIDSRHGLRGYDGKLVDVWASGVMLVAMLLGMFPFDNIDHPDPNTSEAHLEIWCAVASRLKCKLAVESCVAARANIEVLRRGATSPLLPNVRLNGGRRRHTDSLASA